MKKKQSYIVAHVPAVTSVDDQSSDLTLQQIVVSVNKRGLPSPDLLDILTNCELCVCIHK